MHNKAGSVSQGNQKSKQTPNTVKSSAGNDATTPFPIISSQPSHQAKAKTKAKSQIPSSFLSTFSPRKLTMAICSFCLELLNKPAPMAQVTLNCLQCPSAIPCQTCCGLGYIHTDLGGRCTACNGVGSKGHLKDVCGGFGKTIKWQRCTGAHKK